MTYKTAAVNIDLLRRRSGMSQADIGKMLGLSQASASRKLHGLTPFSAEEIVTCADYFGISLDEIYGREPQMKA
ncbi:MULTISPECIES: helix-turn-helix transcriptional regulator [Bifidobacterium]|uniref:helix-turn-helix domain-containing protein n=1 Tax=Bifidobacterium TaxID=1678 RepID=UPI002A920D1D|nr:helix-turn-helix transcriptional regulator [Bifidobacterium sp.]MDY5368334.1 helix-turn-helix transcriptional regulator [Bifidobacterium sp.]